MTDLIKNIISLGCFIAAVVIAIIALYMPVVGIIDSSVLWFTAQLLVMCCSIIGIKFNIKDVFGSNKNKDKE